MDKVKVKFNSSKETTPDFIASTIDSRTFLFVNKVSGNVHHGTHFKDDVFRTLGGASYVASAWIEFEEVNK